MNRKLLFSLLTCMIFTAGAFPNEGVFGAIGDSFDTLINQQEMILALAQSFTDCCSSNTVTFCFDEDPPLVYTDISQSDIPFVINASGNYRVTENLDGSNLVVPMIFVNANDVLLELNGFTLDCGVLPGQQAQIGIEITAHNTITIKNGTIENAAFDGIYAQSGAKNIIIDNCTSNDNGEHGFNFSTGASAFLIGCGGSGNGIYTYEVNGGNNVIGLQNCTETALANFAFAVGPAFGDMGNNS